MKKTGYILIMLSWALIVAGIVIELVLPYDSIIDEPAKNQSAHVMTFLERLYWYFIPAALAGLTGGLLIHKYKKQIVK